MPDAPIPDILNLTYWFSEEVIKSLAYLCAWVNNIEDESVRNFILVAFSENGSRSFLYAGTVSLNYIACLPKGLRILTPDVFGLLSKKLSRNRQGLATFLEKRKDVEVSVSGANTVQR